MNVFEVKHPTHTAQIEGGLLEEEAAHLMREFFKMQRMRNEQTTR
jgi:tRNA(Arg) A34 adenosine deaminase TadA